MHGFVKNFRGGFPQGSRPKHLGNRYFNMNQAATLARIRVVLCQTSHPGNIGAAARAMKTMGLTRLYLVNPKQFPDPEATARASGASDVLENAVVCSSLDEALTGTVFAAALSARQRDVGPPPAQAREGAAELVARAGEGEVALVFDVVDTVEGLASILGSLEEYGIRHYFDPIVLSSEYGRRKPDPAIFHYAARLANVPTSECAYVGDRLARDVEGARRTGFGLAVQIVGLEFLYLLLHIVDTQIALLGSEPCEVPIRLFIGQPVVLPDQQREQIVEEHCGVNAGLVAWQRQILGEAVSKAVAETPKRIVCHRHQLDHHGEKRTQHGVRLGILGVLDQAGHVIQERIQLPREPKRLVLRKPTACMEL